MYRPRECEVTLTIGYDGQRLHLGCDGLIVGLGDDPADLWQREPRRPLRAARHGHLVVWLQAADYRELGAWAAADVEVSGRDLRSGNRDPGCGGRGGHRRRCR